MLRPGSVISISANLSRFSHLNLDLDVLVLDRFSRASCLQNFAARLIVHGHVEVQVQVQVQVR
jgi:hypothetical protein